MSKKQVHLLDPILSNESILRNLTESKSLRARKCKFTKEGISNDFSLPSLCVAKCNINVNNQKLDKLKNKNGKLVKIGKPKRKKSWLDSNDNYYYKIPSDIEIEIIIIILSPFGCLMKKNYYYYYYNNIQYYYYKNY